MTQFKNAARAVINNLAIAAAVGGASVGGAVAQTTANDSAPAQVGTTVGTGYHRAINISQDNTDVSTVTTVLQGPATTKACNEPCAPNFNSNTRNTSTTRVVPVAVTANASIKLPDVRCLGRTYDSTTWVGANGSGQNALKDAFDTLKAGLDNERGFMEKIFNRPDVVVCEKRVQEASPAVTNTTGEPQNTAVRSVYRPVNIEYMRFDH